MNFAAVLALIFPSWSESIACMIFLNLALVAAIVVLIYAGIKSKRIEEQKTVPAVAAGANKRVGLMFCAAILAQLLMLVDMAVPKVYTLATGRAVVVPVVPMDPYDMFRGEYAHFNYNISRVPEGKDFHEGDQVFVVLKDGPAGWTVDRVEKQCPKLDGNMVALKGHLGWSQSVRERLVTYGVEQLYVPQGMSAGLEARKQKISVELAVDKWGNSCIRRVIKNGTTIYDGTEMFNPFST
jgi:uncharacterized membrane-anchored protein